MFIRSSVFAVVFATALFSEPLHIAVLELSANGVSPAEAKAVTMLLQSEFAQNKAYRVIDRGNMESIMKEQELAATGCTESSCAVKIGKMLNVRAMVFGSVSKLGESFFIAVNVIDVETSAVTGTAKAKVKKLDDADEAARDVVTALAEGRSTTTERGVKIDIAMPDIGAIVSNAVATATKAQSDVKKTIPPPAQLPTNSLTPHPGYAVWPVDISIAHPLSITGFEKRGTIVFFSVVAITTFSYKLYGLKVSGIVGITEEDAMGLMVSGIGNVIKENGAGLSVAAIFNAAGSGTIFGQAGLVNVCREGNFVFQAGLVNTSRNMRGMQAGLVNVASETLAGVQVGLVNVAGRFGGVQVGLVNVLREGGLPFMPIGNIGLAF